MTKNKNSIKLYGKICSFVAPNRWGAYQFYVDVLRYNGDVSDHIKCIASEEIVKKTGIEKNDFVSLTGEIQTSMGIDVQTKQSRLFVSAFATDITNFTKNEAEPVLMGEANQVHFVGYVCKKAEVRQTYKGKYILDIAFAIPTQFDIKKKDHTAYLPCVSFGSLALDMAEFEIGDLVDCKGALLARQYKKSGEEITRTTYEAVIYNAVRCGENNKTPSIVQER